ncbi:MAG: alpha/beta fold hydrolase [Acidobacteriota bacterium]
MPSALPYRETPTTIPAVDGFPLASTVFEPTGRGLDRPSVVQIHPATAVERGIYVKYARYLAQHGFTVITFDYRGTGESLRQPIRAFKGRMREWGELDIEGVLRFIADRFPGHRHLCVAHSVGGQVLGLAPSVGRLDAVWAVATQWGTWKLWPAPRRYFYKVLFHGVAPAMVGVFGYFPGRWLGMGDLPGSIGMDWMRWCRSAFYIQDDSGQPLRPHFHELTARVRWNGFADDPQFGPPKAVAHMPTLYPNARNEVRIIHPDESGHPAIGHFGFFRSRFESTLWSASVDWLLAEETSPAPSAALDLALPIVTG